MTNRIPPMTLLDMLVAAVCAVLLVGWAAGLSWVVHGIQASAQRTEERVEVLHAIATRPTRGKNPIGYFPTVKLEAPRLAAGPESGPEPPRPRPPKPAPPPPEPPDGGPDAPA